MKRCHLAISLAMLAGSTAWSAETPVTDAPHARHEDSQSLTPNETRQRESKAPRAMLSAPDAKPQIAQPRPPSGPLRPPQVFLPPTRPTPLLVPGDDSGQRRPSGTRQASVVAHRTERHSSTIFGSPAIETPRRFGPVQPVQSGPAPLKRRTFAW